MQHAKNAIAEELKIFEKKFADSVKADKAALNQILKYIIKRKGKQLRPMFVFLSAKLFAPVQESTYRAAALVEMLHTATLVHDDVVDEAYERRGFFSINAIWKNKIAVLVGDFLLSKGLILSAENGDYVHLEYMSQAVRKMSEGELLQIEKTRSLNLDEEIYFEIIRNKTASLLSAACAIGAFSTTNDRDLANKMGEFGELVGIAFQIKDDLFDYGNDKIGKPKGNDIQEKKITLPIIHALQQASKSKKRELVYLLKNKNTDKVAVKQIIEDVRNLGGVDYATAQMELHKDRALQLIEDMPNQEIKYALADLVHYTIDRTY